MKAKLFYLFIAVFFMSFNGQAQVVKCPEGNPWPHCISLMGPGTPNGNWDDDNYLTSTDGDVWTAVDMQFSKGQIKFRQDGCWEKCAGNPAGWGPALSTETGWPSGQNTNPVPFGPNIECPGGVWNVKFTISTQSWEFTPGTPNKVVTLIGTAAPGAPITMDTSDGIIYTLKKVDVSEGTLQFTVNGAVYGGLGFPAGAAYVDNEFIPVSAADAMIDYDITFNANTFDYSFVQGSFPQIALVGSAAGGWPPSPQPEGYVDQNIMTTTDGITYTLNNVPIIPGGMVFRQDNAWSVKYGNVTFPDGTGGNGADIIVPAGSAGSYNVTLNTTTKTYVFKLNTIAIVGDGAEGWPPYPQPEGYKDPVSSIMKTTDGVVYTLDAFVIKGGNVKFRQNNDWNPSWGGPGAPAGWPTGSGGSDIPTVAGTYNITLNTSTGVYDFGTALSTKNFTIAGLKTYPNPTQNNWNITANDQITSVQVFDILGKSVITKAFSSNEVSVSATKLSRGVYFAKISTAKGSTTVKLVKE